MENSEREKFYNKKLGGGVEGRAILCPVASVDMDKPHVGVFPEL